MMGTNFTDVSVFLLIPTVANPYGFSFADTDHDNDLDLYIVARSQLSQNKY